MAQWSIDAESIKQILRSNGINRLCHFTDISNLSGIRKHGGLLSKHQLESLSELSNIVTGGNELSLNLDRELGNWDKVHLYFCPNTPMAYRKQQHSHICYLAINVDVALWEGVLFTDTNATRKINGHIRAKGQAGLNAIHFEAIRSTLRRGPQPWDQKWHRNIQAECLVSNSIPLNEVTEIVFISKASLELGKRLWGNFLSPKFSVDQKSFYNGYPWLESALLTPLQVTKDNVANKYVHNDTFDIKTISTVTLLVSLHANAGLEAKVVWRDSQGNIIDSDVSDFRTEGGYWHWPGLDIAGLQEGQYCVEYYLADIFWSAIPFAIRRV